MIQTDTVDFLSENLTREKYSGKLENTLSMLINMYFNGTPDAMKKMLAAAAKSLVSSSGGIMSNPRLRHIVVEEVITALDPFYREDGVTLFGDADGDGTITINDATLIQEAAIGLVVFTDRQKMLSDVNDDGRVSVLDVTCVQKYIAEHQTGFGKTGTVCG